MSQLFEINRITSVNDIIKGIPLERLAEICQAERDGRCVVLPCKVGNIIYTAGDNGFSYEWKVWKIEHFLSERYEHIRIRACCENAELDDEDFWHDDFGKTVFLTREAALKEGAR